MNLKDLLDEALSRGEKLKDEILEDIVKSKTLNRIVSNPNFASAVGRVIETTDEVKKVIQKQVKGLFEVMSVPTKHDFAKVGHKIAEMEKSIEHLGAKKIQVKRLAKPTRKKAAGKTAASRRKTGKTRSAKN